MSKTPIIYDGSKGSVLTKYIKAAAEKDPSLNDMCIEYLNIINIDAVIKMHKDYIEAGAVIIQTNTFNCNEIALAKHHIADKQKSIIERSVYAARQAASCGVRIALSYGPTGNVVLSGSNFTYDDAYNVYRNIALCIPYEDIDIVHMETFTDLYEMKASIAALKDVLELDEFKNVRRPDIYCSFSFEANGRTLMGDTAQQCAKLVESMGASAVGINCMFPDDVLAGIITAMKQVTYLPIIAKPNAGKPVVEGGVSVYKETPNDFAGKVLRLTNCGAELIGGCCGTVPEYISAIYDRMLLNESNNEEYKLISIFGLQDEELIDLAYDMSESEGEKYIVCFSKSCEVLPLLDTLYMLHVDDVYIYSTDLIELSKAAIAGKGISKIVCDVSDKEHYRQCIALYNMYGCEILIRNGVDRIE